MKVYQVTMPYFDGDHDHGHYESPLFATKELAEQFKDYVTSPNTPEKYRWECYLDYVEPEISTFDIVEEPVDVEDSEEYLTITYT